MRGDSSERCQRIKQQNGMLVTLRKRTLGPDLVVGWSAQGGCCGGDVRKVLVDKNKLVSCLQMLHEKETSVLTSTKNAFVKIRNTGNDSFVLAFGRVDEAPGKTQSQASQTECETYISPQGIRWLTPAQDAHASMVQLLTYARQQLLPTYSKASCVAQRMQAEFGNVATLRGGEAYDMRVDEAFMLNNASTVSKLLDMLNAAKCGRRLSAAHASRLAWLAAVFCSAAPASKAFSLFNVTQMQMTTMSDYTTEPCTSRPRKNSTSRCSCAATTPLMIASGASTSPCACSRRTASLSGS